MVGNLFATNDRTEGDKCKKMCFPSLRVTCLKVIHLIVFYYTYSKDFQTFFIVITPTQNIHKKIFSKLCSFLCYISFPFIFFSKQEAMKLFMYSHIKSFQKFHLQKTTFKNKTPFYLKKRRSEIQLIFKCNLIKQEIICVSYINIFKCIQKTKIHFNVHDIIIYILKLIV